MKRDLAKILLVVLALAALATIGMLLLSGRNATASTPLPDPNGYETFLKAARRLTGNYGSYKAVSNDELAGLVADNASAVDLARTGLKQQSRVAFQFEQGEITNLLVRLIGLKSLTQAFAAEGELAHLKGRTNDAIRCYLESIRVGQESSRGGLIVHRLFSAGVGVAGLRQFDMLTNNLPAPLCREVAQQLEALDAFEESPKETFANEAYWNRRVYGIVSQISALFAYSRVQEVKQSLVTRLNEMQLRRRTLAITFAARAYELEQGKRPNRIQDLAPEYLKTIPRDPATGESLTLP